METFKHFTESQKMQAESQKEIAETRARFDGKIKELQESRDELHKQLATANADHKEAARRTETLEEQLTAATAKMTTLETTATQATEQLQAKVRELELAQVELNRLRIENGTVKDEWEAKVMVATGKCAVAEEKYAEMQQKQAEWEAEKETFEAQLKVRTSELHRTAIGKWLKWAREHECGSETDVQVVGGVKGSVSLSRTFLCAPIVSVIRSADWAWLRLIHRSVMRQLV